MNILSCHEHEFFNSENVADLALFNVELLQESINYIISSVDDCKTWVAVVVVEQVPVDLFQKLCTCVRT